MKVEVTRICMEKIKMTVLSIIIISIDLLILQFSMRGVWYILSLDIMYGVINLGILSVFVGVLYVITHKLWIAELICNVIITVYAIVNVYVIEFHGTPLTIPEFKNTKTALNVLHGYSLIDFESLVFVAIICVFFVLNIVLIYFLKKNKIEEGKKVVHKRYFFECTILFVGIAVITLIMQADSLIKPLHEGWHFKEIAGKYGYPFYFLASGLEYKIDEPKGYAEEKLNTIQVEEDLNEVQGEGTKPDIIVILNESFYDISLVSDIETDVDIFEEFYKIENSVSGHVVVPRIGGGTNNSEYELLTSNSTYLFQGITPFQTLDMSDTSSIISNLSELGYYTIGMHPAAASNYSRNTGYSLLGFEEIHFEDDFIEKDYYGNRKLLTDNGAYEYMLQWYENALEKNRPIFSYMLTIQNHGDWNSNSSDEDIVHVQNYDNKADEERMNEYLSCISLSIDAFNELREYFNNSDRQVILCMVGDHAPSFIDDIISNKDPILQRATPFIIWANFPIEEKKDVMLGMSQLAPMLLDMAEVKMMPYYQYLIQLGNDVSVLTGYGDYIDKEGNVHSYNESTKYSETIQKYFWLEYNNIQKDSIDEWFSVK